MGDLYHEKLSLSEPRDGTANPRKTKPGADVLDVVAVVSNPKRYESRYRLFNDFRDRMERNPSVRLTVVEAAHADRPFAVTTKRDVQLRTEHELWQKEAMINVGISRLNHDARYVAWIDADVNFLRTDWAEETIESLKHYSVVQPWSHTIDMGPNCEIIQVHNSFCYEYMSGKPYSPGVGTFWHPGYAWAARKDVLDDLGGVMDFPILGAADHHMATAFIGRVDAVMNWKMTDGYRRKCLAWQDRAEEVVNRNIGCVQGTIAHYWHGKKKDRRYKERREILVKHNFCPDTDIRKDTSGLWVLCSKKTGLRDDIRNYLSARNEDSIDVN